MTTGRALSTSPKAYEQPGAVRGACHDDRGASFDVAEVWRGMSRDARRVAIPNCGHLPHEDQPDRVNDELLRFLDTWRG